MNSGIYKVVISDIAELTEEVTRVELESVRISEDATASKIAISITINGEISYEMDKAFIKDSINSIAAWSLLKPDNENVYKRVSVEHRDTGETKYMLQNAFVLSYQEKFDELCGSFILVVKEFQHTGDYVPAEGEYPDLSEFIVISEPVALVQEEAQDENDGEIEDTNQLANNSNFDKLIAEAEKHLGKPYKWSGSGPDTFDCSGYICWVFIQSGVRNTGRVTAQDLYNMSDHVQPSDVQPGDLIFFTNTYATDDDVTHVGIYMGDNQMIHCSSSKGVVISSINTQYYQDHFYAYGRID